MIRIVVLVVIFAIIAAAFTKPDEATLQRAAENALQGALQDVGAEANVSATSLGSADDNVAVGDRSYYYEDYWVAARYSASASLQPYVSCWGFFKQVRCETDLHVLETA